MVRFILSFSSVSISPDSSHKPTATVIISTSPRGGNEVKLVITFPRSQYSPSMEKKFWINTVSSLAGFMTDTCSLDNIRERTAVIQKRYMNIIPGCGSLLHNVSIWLRNLPAFLLFAFSICLSLLSAKLYVYALFYKLNYIKSIDENTVILF